MNTNTTRRLSPAARSCHLAVAAVLTLSGFASGADAQPGKPQPGKPETTRQDPGTREQDPVDLGIRAYDQRDFGRAMQLLRTPADAGNRIAQRLCGRMLQQGLGTSKDLRSALRFFTLSAEQDDHESTELLGRMFLAGQGTDADLDKAIQAFRRAAMLGHGQAMFDLGYCYGTGKGVQKDLVEALTWYELAVRYGVSAAEKNRNSVAQELGDERTRSASERATELARTLDSGGFPRSEVPAVPVAEFLRREREEAPKPTEQDSPFDDIEDATEQESPFDRVTDEEDSTEERSIFDSVDEDATDQDLDPFVGAFEGTVTESAGPGQTLETQLQLTIRRDGEQLIATAVGNARLPDENGQLVEAVLRGEFRGPKQSDGRILLNSSSLELELPARGQKFPLPAQTLELRDTPDGLLGRVGNAEEGYSEVQVRRSNRRVPNEPTSDLSGPWTGTAVETLPDGRALTVPLEIQVRGIRDDRSSLTMSGTIEIPTEGGQTMHIDFTAVYEGRLAEGPVSMESTRLDVTVRENGQKPELPTMRLVGTLENGVLRGRYGSDETGYSSIEARPQAAGRRPAPVGPGR